jgi:CoA:oxalate CoA-transferase
MFAAWGIAAALYAREHTGEGRYVDIAMLDSIMAMQLTGLSRQLYFGETPRPVGNRHPVTYPVDSFPTRTGDIVLVCFSESLFRRLAALIGRPDLAGDSRFATNAARNANEAELRALITGWTESFTADEAVERLLDAGIPAAPVWDLGELVRSPHVAARGLIVEGRHGRFGAVPLVPQPVKFSNTSPRDYITPMLGEHTETVLADLLGLASDEIGALRKKKVI